MMLRKSGLFFVVIVPLVALAWLYLARNVLVAGLAELALERMLGTEVQVEGVELEPFDMRASLGQVRIVDPDAPARYLLVAGPARLDLNGLQLFARKFVVDDLSVEGVAFGVPRPDAPAAARREAKARRGTAPEGRRPAGKQPPADNAPATLPEQSEPPEDWTLDLPLPELDLSALETELDVGRLTGGELGSLQTLGRVETESARRIERLQRRSEKLDAGPRAAAIQKRIDQRNFDSRDPRETRETLVEVKQALDQLKALRDESRSLVRDVRNEPKLFRDGLAEVRREVNLDVDAALRLAGLGDLDVQRVAALVFGPAVLEQFNWVLTRFQQVRGMLSSDGDPPAEPPRRAGRLLAFPVTARAYPGFLIERAAFSGTSAAALEDPLRYTGSLTGLSSNAAVYGEPVRLNATAASQAGAAWEVNGVFDHRAAVSEDRIQARGTRVKLSDLALSGGSLPERATARSADIGIDAGLRGSALSAGLRIDARQVAFAFGAEAAGQGATQQAIREMFAEVATVRLEASLTGTLRDPSVRMSSSLDELFAERLDALIGRRRAEIEARIRGQIEQRLNERRQAVEQSLATQRGTAEAEIERAEATLRDAQERLAERQRALEARLKASGSDALQRLRRR